MLFTAFRRKFRSVLQRAIALITLTSVFIFIYSYMNLEFCYRIMSQNSLTNMCKKYKNNEYSGSLCEELCCNSEAFNDFKCPQNEIRTIVFTAEKNGDVYAVKLAKQIRNDIGWTNSQGAPVYPQIEDFHHVVKMHIAVTYNVTLDDNMIRALVNQEIDKNNPEHMMSFWRLFKDNNYMMGKLFDEESIFPTILGSCGPFYSTEYLTTLQMEQSLMHYISYDWKHRLKLALNIIEYIFRMDEMRPEPLKMCKMRINLFGLTADKRIKYQSAEYVRLESQLDKQLSNGVSCTCDEDCHWHACMGGCDPLKLICNRIQQNSNLQIFCRHLLKGRGLFPGLLAMAATPKSLVTLLSACIDPTTVHDYQAASADRPYAPNTELAMRLYNEMKRLYKGLSAEHGYDEN